jgi:tripartite-type tricarboxylate transporter receptor subunit TctC
MCELRANHCESNTRGETDMSHLLPKRLSAFMLATLAAVLCAAPASSQTKPDYPKRTVTVVVPMGAGAGPDLTTRKIAKRLEERLGQPFIIENKPGQAGGVGSAHVARANPDGYTIMLSFLSANVFNPIIHKNLAYRPVKDLAFISMLYDTPFVVGVSAKSDVKTFKQLVAKLKNNPPSHSYASGGVGSAAHVGAAMLLRVVGAEGVVHVPYRTTAAVFPDLIEDRVAFSVSSPDSMNSYFQSGALQPLLVTGPQRLPSLPNVPTAVEEGYPELRASSWYVLQAPAAVPKEIIELLNKEVNEILTEPDMIAWFKQAEAMPMPGYTPEAATKFYEEEKARWEPHVRASGASAQAQ